MLKLTGIGGMASDVALVGRLHDLAHEDRVETIVLDRRDIHIEAFGDGDGIVILPQEIADEVSRECAEQELLETFCRMKLEEGRAMPGTYPPNDVTRREFEEWRSRQPK